MSKFSKEQLLEVLGYSDSPNYCATEGQHHPLTAHLFREAKRAGAEGTYLIHTSHNDEILPPRPAVFIASANTREEARAIHHSLWNLGNTPFLIVVLPNEIRIYTGFDYDQRNPNKGLIGYIDDFTKLDLSSVLSDYKADSIDSGRIWAEQAKHLKSENRVDAHLLRNLRKLEEVLCKNGLKLETAHALIGKYVYIRYLWDRGVLSEQWRAENKINIDSVLGRNATLKGLRRLVEALDERFNGHIFPLPLRGSEAPTDDQVALAAKAFEGDDPATGQMTIFGLYDFSYIPVETLSAIYEQFLHAQGKGKKSGAVYTPEILADYLLAELNHAKPLETGMKVLDPCCGSGIFLVLAYRKLIELELSKRPNQKLLPTELRTILTQSIFGVERNKEACFVTELSLILTMLHYITPPELHRNKQFKFPALHNQQIFQADFFDDSSVFWQRNERFDWIIGNPPWVQAEVNDEEHLLVLDWINKPENRQSKPVGDNRIVEAFSWRTTDLLKEHGHVGLILHAKSLFNHKSKKYRHEFFRQHEVARITNFSNFAYIMFKGRGDEPAATISYTKAIADKNKDVIIHYGPFLVNQMSGQIEVDNEKPGLWSLTINEDEITAINPDDAEKGETLTWKLALWGSDRDKKAIQRLQNLFPTNLGKIVTRRGWSIHQGVALREFSEEAKNKIEYVAELLGRDYFDPGQMIKSNLRFSVPVKAFTKILPRHCYILKRNGKASLQPRNYVHLLFNAAYTAFCDRDFVFGARTPRLSAAPEDADELRALSLWYSSSIARYYLFLTSPAWGIGRNAIDAEEIKQIPIPVFSTQQLSKLAELQRELARLESKAETSNDQVKEYLQKLLDEGIERIIDIPKSLRILAKDLMSIRLSLNKGKTESIATQTPGISVLQSYGETLRDELDNFTKGRLHHKISFLSEPFIGMVVCKLEATNIKQPLEINFDNANDQIKSLNHLKQQLRQQFSQWVYVQRSLRIFDGPRVYICKSPRLIDWTKTQALNDADDLIAEILSGNFGEREVAVNGQQ